MATWQDELGELGDDHEDWTYAAYVVTVSLVVLSVAFLVVFNVGRAFGWWH